jgi:hypothetical protein
MRNFILSVMLFPALCSAGDLQYLCIVSAELSLQEYGNIKPHTRPIEIGKSFTVDRISGKVISPLLRNITAAEV